MINYYIIYTIFPTFLTSLYILDWQIFDLYLTDKSWHLWHPLHFFQKCKTSHTNIIQDITWLTYIPYKHHTNRRFVWCLYGMYGMFGDVWRFVSRDDSIGMYRLQIFDLSVWCLRSFRILILTSHTNLRFVTHTFLTSHTNRRLVQGSLNVNIKLKICWGQIEDLLGTNRRFDVWDLLLQIEDLLVIDV